MTATKTKAREMPPLAGQPWMQAHAKDLDEALGSFVIAGSPVPDRDRLTSFARALRSERIRSLRSAYDSARRDLEGLKAETDLQMQKINAALGLGWTRGDDVSEMAKRCAAEAARLLDRSTVFEHYLTRERRIVDALVAKTRGDMEAP